MISRTFPRPSDRGKIEKPKQEGMALRATVLRTEVLRAIAPRAIAHITEAACYLSTIILWVTVRAPALTRA